MKIRTFALGLALVGAPLPLLAQQAPNAQSQGGWQRGRHGGGWQQGGQRVSPIQRLISSQQLGLSSAQVQRLQSIDQDLQGRNRPLMDRMRALREQAVPGLAQRGQGGAQGQRPQLTQQQRDALKRTREQSRPLTEQMRANNKAAMEQVKSVLTSAQKEQLKAMHRQERGNRKHGEHGHGRRDGAQTMQQRS